MKIKQPLNYTFVFLFLFIIIACTSYKTRLFDKGRISKSNFSSKINIETTNYLSIIPVQIKGKTYRFLLDTGAPFSISESLQNKFNYKVINQVKMEDSDKSKKTLNFVSVDSIQIGEIDFTNQSAFVGDFTKNPILECLNLDGIIGSNVMKHCNWTININDNWLELSKGRTLNSEFTIPFNTNKQFDIKLPLTLNTSTFSGIKIDYGSNGYISLPSLTFNKIRNDLNTSYTQRGFVQSGLFGVRSPFETEFGMIDSVKINNLHINTVIKQGKSALIGNRILSQFLTNINWESQTIGFTPLNTVMKPYSNFGFTVGFTNTFVVQSVIKGSFAEKEGVKPNMKIQKIIGMDNNVSHSLCDYLYLDTESLDELNIIFNTEEGDTISKKIKRTIY